MKNFFELVPQSNTQQSFGRKAFVEIDGNVRNLWSYNTLVATIDTDKNELTIIDNYSVTTSKHQKEFARQHGFTLPKGAIRTGVYTK